MGWFRRPLRLIYDTFRNYNFNNPALLRTPVQKSSSTISRTEHFCTSSSKLNFIKSRNFERHSQPVFRNTVLHNFLKQQNQLKSHPSLHGTKRFYYVDERNIYHFKRKRWFEDQKKVLKVLVVGSGVLLCLYYKNMETVPYTKRSQFLLFSRTFEKEIGDIVFDSMKQEYKDERKLLPSTHPYSIRAQKIGKKIVGAAERGGMMKESQEWCVDMWVLKIAEAIDMAIDRVMGLELWEWKAGKWVLTEQEEENNNKSHIGNSKGFNWEFLVVDNPDINAFCAPGGKIVLYSGFLKHFQKDAEIAAVIGHEVGHALARHSAETLSKYLWWYILEKVFFRFAKLPFSNNKVSEFLINLFLRLPFSRRNELEADYIGLMLMASAGYDPQVAPKLEEKLGRITGDSGKQDYFSTHPCCKKRVEALSNPLVMEKALAFYWDSVKKQHENNGIFSRIRSYLSLEYKENRFTI